MSDKNIECFEEMDKDETLLQIVNIMRGAKDKTNTEQNNMFLGGILLALTYLVSKSE